MKKLLIFLTLIVFLSSPAFAADIDGFLFDASGAEQIENAVPDDAKKLMQDIELDKELDFSSSFIKILDGAAHEGSSIFKAALRSAVLLICIAILNGICCCVFESSSAPDSINLACTLAIGAFSVNDFSAFIGLGRETVFKLYDFSKVILPVLASAAAASGAAASSAVKYSVTAFFLDILISLSSDFIFPLIYAYIACTIAASATGTFAMSGAAKLFKWCCVTLMTLLSLCFIAYINLSGAIAGNSDALTSRLAKTVMTTSFPIVGSIISDASLAVSSGVSLLKNAIGGFGLLAVISICLIPFLRLGTHYILYKLSANFSGAMSEHCGKLMNELCSAFSMIMGLTGACAVFLFFSLISLLEVIPT